MADLDANLAPYVFVDALAKDRADTENCFVLDVGCNDSGEEVPSLKHVEDKVHEYFLYFHELKVPITKLYIVGRWNLHPATEEELETSYADENFIKQMAFHKSEAREAEMSKAVMKIMELVAQMPMLKELTWVSRFPVVPAVLEKLPPLTKLVLDLGQATKLLRDDLVLHKSYITAGEMTVLLQQTQLKELRLFRLHDSFQLLVWEMVFRNQAKGGMNVVDLQMFSAPLIRSASWREAAKVDCLSPRKFPKDNSREKEYKGMDGKGILHYCFGTGEYLDDFCMRKARIASGLNEAKPAPLYCLKLNGFVVDHLPFLNELSHIVLLSCDWMSIDAGLRVPTASLTIPEEWSKIVGTVIARCVIQWPDWMRAFDEHGKEIAGKVLVPFNPQMTQHSPELHELEERLAALRVNPSDSGDNETVSSVTAGSSADAASNVSVMSNVSTRGSEVPWDSVPATPILSSSEGPLLPFDDVLDLSSSSESESSVPDFRVSSGSCTVHGAAMSGCQAEGGCHSARDL